MSPAEYAQLERDLAADGFGPDVAFALALLGEQLQGMREARYGTDARPAFLAEAVDALLCGGGVDPGEATVADVVALRAGLRPS